MFPTAELFVIAIGAAIAIAIIWSVQFRSYAFYVVVIEGRPIVRRGQASAAFLEHIAEVCADYRVKSAWVGGIRHGHDIRLTFSRSLPAGGRQRLRNAWPFVR